MQVCYKKSWKC